MHVDGLRRTVIMVDFFMLRSANDPVSVWQEVGSRLRSEAHPSTEPDRRNWSVAQYHEVGIPIPMD